MAGLSNNGWPSLICHSHPLERTDDHRKNNFEAENSENSVLNSLYMLVKEGLRQKSVFGALA